MDAAGTAFELSYTGQSVPISNALLGRHNVLNCLAAAASCPGLGVKLGTIAEALSRPIRVPGRLERVESAAPFEVLVDYAHTDDALDNALSAVAPLTRGRLIVLFGCGGNRDRTKRAAHGGRGAAAAPNVVIVTSDNPRTEDPRRIIDEILTGFDRPGDKLQRRARPPQGHRAGAGPGPARRRGRAGRQGSREVSDHRPDEASLRRRADRRRLAGERFGPRPAASAGAATPPRGDGASSSRAAAREKRP